MPMQCTKVYLLIPLIEMNCLIDKRLQIIAELFQQLNRLKLPHLLHWNLIEQTCLLRTLLHADKSLKDHNVKFSIVCFRHFYQQFHPAHNLLLNVENLAQIGHPEWFCLYARQELVGPEIGAKSYRFRALFNLVEGKPWEMVAATLFDTIGRALWNAAANFISLMGEKATFLLRFGIWMIDERYLAHLVIFRGVMYTWELLRIMGIGRVRWVALGL